MPTTGLDTRPRTECSENRPEPAPGMTLGWLRLCSHAQADFRFNGSGWNCSPFFQIRNTIAAILRAGV